MSETPELDTSHEVGSAYRSVLRLSPELALARKAHLLSLFAGADDLVHLDLDGRLHRAWLAGSSYQRGLDGRVRKVDVARDGRSRSFGLRVLSGLEAGSVFGRVAELVRRAADVLPADADPELAEPLTRAGAFATADAYRELAARFRETYEPIPILPPAENRALVVQLTSGCSWNRCSFCHLYRDTTFSVKTPVALKEHLARVLALVGRALPLRRGVFLGQANALVVSRDKLLPLLELVRDELARSEAPASFGVMSAFIDAFSKLKSLPELVELRQRGLASVALGLESASPAVLAALGKPAEAAAAEDLVERLHAAGIRVGVIVLVGAGGAELEAEHIRETLSSVARMALTRQDRVYLSPLTVHSGSVYEAAGERLGVLAAPELEAQSQRFQSGLRELGVNAPIARYDIRRFIY